MSNNYVAIMAGGVGSRFWPASRTAKPKQFLDILGVGKTLLQMTYERHLRLVPKENIFIVTNAQYRDLVKEQLPEITDNQILGEPSRNNTAPCLAYMTLKLQGINPKANFIVASSDHLILKEEVYLAKIQQAFDFVSQDDVLMTLGITPTRPDTGYGYINFAKRDANDDGIFKVKQFREKPDLQTAKEYVASGNFLWNAGIFIWSVKSLLKSFGKNAPDILAILDKPNVYNTASEQDFINEYYPTTPDISIDYAIMEKAENIYTIPSDIGWSDLGTWGSLHEESNRDADGNAINGDHVMLYDVKNSLIRVPKNKLTVIKDLEDYIVVDEDDILMIVPKSKEQEIKTITKEVGKQKGDFYI
jgi:mannose-1-phosphate guanylyltransferase